METFIKDPACPAWLFNRYEVHNRVETRKRKASERKDGVDDKQPMDATEAQDDEADDETDQGVIRRQSEANAPQLNNARIPPFPPWPLACDVACLLGVGLAC